MAYRNKIYVAFDGDKDMHYYRLMRAWKQHEKIDFNFYDAHDITQARDSSSEASIKASLRNRLLESKVFVILIGESTKYLYKFVRWEIEQAISLGLPIICVNLNQSKVVDSLRCPAILYSVSSIHIPFRADIMQYALEHWPERHRALTAQGPNAQQPRYYTDSVYASLPR